MGSKNDIILDDDTLLLSISFCDVTLSCGIKKADLWKKDVFLFLIYYQLASVSIYFYYL